MTDWGSRGRRGPGRRKMTVFRFEDDLVTKERSGEKIRIHLDSTEVIIRSRGRRRKTSCTLWICNLMPFFRPCLTWIPRCSWWWGLIRPPNPTVSQTCTSQDSQRRKIESSKPFFPPLFVYLKNFSEVWIITDEKLYVYSIWSIFKHIFSNILSLNNFQRHGYEI